MSGGLLMEEEEEEIQLSTLEEEIHYVHTASKGLWRRKRRKFTTSIQPAKAYEDESVIMSEPH